MSSSRARSSSPGPHDRMVIGRFTVITVLGSGGMGVVYAAYDPELDRKVAVKLVRASVVSSRRASRARERLLREAQAMARLAHPNVVTVHDVGEHDGQVFIAMEFVRGMTLLEWCRDFPRRPWSETLETYMQAGRGLAAAHRQGIIHRDFKPDSQKPTCHTGQQPLALHSAFVWA